jgi:hypothetical protein
VEEPEVVEKFWSSLKGMLLISQSEFLLQPGNSSRGTGSCGKVPEQPEEHAVNQSMRILLQAGNSSRGIGSCGKVPEQPERHAINQSVRIQFASRQQQQRNRK